MKCTRFLIILLFLSLTVYTYSQTDKEKTLYVSYSATNIQYNPLHSYTSTEAQIFSAIYEGLVNYHPFTLEPVAAAASFWEISDDGKTYKFHIRENAKYWNGDMVTAEDFGNSWFKLIDPKEDAEYSFLLDIIKGALAYRTGKTDNKKDVGIRVLSDTILEVELIHPASHFLKILCHHSFTPVHPDFLKLQEWKDVPSVISNGPYYIKNHSGSSIELVKNNLYWDRQNVKIPRITIIFTADPEKSAAMFNKEEIHWSGSGTSWDKIENKSAMIINPLFATSYFFFSSKTPPWDNAVVRRGLSLLLPWDEIRSKKHMFIPTETLVPKIGIYPDVEGIKTKNTVEAFSLLKNAGFPEGKGLPDIILKIPDDSESRRIAEIMKKTWEKSINSKIIIHDYPFGEYYNTLRDTDFTIGTMTWIGDFADPLSFLQMWTTESNLNDAEYSNNNYDNIISDSLKYKESKRYKFLSEAEEIILHGAAVLPINNQPAFNLIDLTVIEGWFPNPLDIHPFKYLYFTAPKLIPGVVSRSIKKETI